MGLFGNEVGEERERLSDWAGMLATAYHGE